MPFGSTSDQAGPRGIGRLGPEAGGDLRALPGEVRIGRGQRRGARLGGAQQGGGPGCGVGGHAGTAGRVRSGRARRQARPGRRGPAPPQQVRRVRRDAAHARISRLRTGRPPSHSRLSRLSRPLYFVTGFPRLSVTAIDPQGLRTELSRLLVN